MEKRNKKGQYIKGTKPIAGFVKGCNLENKHFRWKGDNAGYRAIHNWVERRLGKPNFCEFCRNGTFKHRQYQWANISKEYKRDLTDWVRLCVSCHKKYDRKN